MATFLEATARVVGEDAVVPCCDMTSETYTMSYLRPNYRQAVEIIVAVTWMLLPASPGMLLTHKSIHTFLCCCTPTGLEGVCYEFYSSSNAEQHWAQHIAVFMTIYTTTYLQFKDVCHKSPSSKVELLRGLAQINQVCYFSTLILCVIISVSPHCI